LFEQNKWLARCLFNPIKMGFWNAKLARSNILLSAC
jgi:hypothetical protein